jgi:outer membrane protein assembly factor BamB
MVGASLRKLMVGAGLVAFAVGSVFAEEWPDWRGPRMNGTSTETGLVSSWSRDGENLIWKAPLVGRSTPVIVDGRVCVMSRTDDAKPLRQERVACYDAGDGKLLWEDRYNVYHTTVPFNRVAWGSPVADPETGNLYTLGVAGLLHAYDAKGKLLWSHATAEEYGRQSGYGGRTQTPMVDGDLLIVTIVNTGWGVQNPPRDRYFAFDKRTGELVWVSTPGGNPEDFNNQSVPVVAEINGVRLLINGGADGRIYALKAGTGEKVWEFQLSKRGLHSNVVVDGTMVYAAHSEENVDEATQGRVVAIDGTGTGDVTKTHERWRVDELAAGFSSPAIGNGRLYVVDNGADLYALDLKTGAKLWTYNLGTVGKGSPVLADGKLYVAEVNGRFHIIEPSDKGAKELDLEMITMPEGRHAEIYGSPAVAYGRVYFTTEEGLYCLGDKSKPFKRSAPGPKPAPPAKGELPATVLQIVPAEVLVRPGDKVSFRARSFDAKGRLIGETPAQWTMEGLTGALDAATGQLTLDANTPFQGGTIKATAGGLTASARARAITDLPWSFDFEAMPEGKAPVWWVGGGNPWAIRTVDGNKVLVKVVREVGLLRNEMFFGPSTPSNYTIQADVYAEKKGRKIPDIGIIANGYTLDLMGGSQQLQLRSWASEQRNSKDLPFPWEPGSWFTMKLRVDVKKDGCHVAGKVWPRGETEPADWTIVVDDPLPIPSGSPGLIGYSPVEIFYDNIRVTKNE